MRQAPLQMACEGQRNNDGAVVYFAAVYQRANFSGIDFQDIDILARIQHLLICLARIAC